MKPEEVEAMFDNLDKAFAGLTVEEADRIRDRAIAEARAYLSRKPHVTLPDVSVTETCSCCNGDGCLHCDS